MEARVHGQREEAERREAELATSLESQDRQALTEKQLPLLGGGVALVRRCGVGLAGRFLLLFL